LDHDAKTSFDGKNADGIVVTLRLVSVLAPSDESCHLNISQQNDGRSMISINIRFLISSCHFVANGFAHVVVDSVT